MTPHEGPTAVASGPRERALLSGVAALSEAELVALLLGTGASGASALAVSEAVLRAHGGVHGLARASPRSLAEHRGVGPGKATRLAAALEIGRRALASPLRPGATISSSDAVDRVFRPRLTHADVEQVVVLALDSRSRVRAEIQVGLGALTQCGVTPGDIFRVLLREGAAAAILVHNHPSGIPTPSPEDVAFTARVVAAGRLLGVRLVDHVIVAREGYTSFLDSGRLPE